MLQVLNSLAPIVLLIALGAALAKLRFHTDAFRQSLDKFVYYIALPCLFVAELADADLAGGAAAAVSLVLAIVTMLCLVAGVALAAALLAVLRVGGETGRAMLASAIKVALAPALAAMLVPLLGLSGPQAQIAMVFAATPTAVASYVLAGQLGGDPRLAASTVVVSTLLSLVPLSVILWAS